MYRGREYGVLVEGPEHRNLPEGVPQPGKRYSFNPAIIPEVDEFELVPNFFFFPLPFFYYFFFPCPWIPSTRLHVHHSPYHDPFPFLFGYLFSVTATPGSLFGKHAMYRHCRSQAQMKPFPHLLGVGIAIPDSHTTKTCPSLGRSKRSNAANMSTSSPHRITTNSVTSKT